MIEVTCNDRLGKKVRIKCNPDDTIGDLKKLISAQTGTRWDKIVLKKWYTIFKDNITLEDSYEMKLHLMLQYSDDLRNILEVEILSWMKNIQEDRCQL